MSAVGAKNGRHNSILRNEKYYGAALLQKKFTYDFLTKKTKKNCGELPQYYIENDHTPIVSKAHYDAAQERLAIKQRQRTTRTPYAGKLVCDCCQQIYSRKSWHSTTTRDPVWECPQRFQGKPKCATPHIYQQQLTEAYHEAFRGLLDENSYPIDICLSVLKEILSPERIADVEEYFAAVAMRETPQMSYDPAMWLTLVERVIVCTDRRQRFVFIDGHETVVDIPGRMRSHREKMITISEGATDMENIPEKKERRLLSETEKKQIIEGVKHHAVAHGRIHNGICQEWDRLHGRMVTILLGLIKFPDGGFLPKRDHVCQDG